MLLLLFASLPRRLSMMCAAILVVRRRRGRTRTTSRRCGAHTHAGRGRTGALANGLWCIFARIWDCEEINVKVTANLQTHFRAVAYEILCAPEE